MTIDNVRLSTDIVTAVPAPFECKADGNTQCNYYSQNVTAPRFQLACECGFAQANGYCPWPDQTFVTTAGSLMAKTLNYSQCHTYDRLDLLA